MKTTKITNADFAELTKLVGEEHVEECLLTLVAEIEKSIALATKEKKHCTIADAVIYRIAHQIKSSAKLIDFPVLESESTNVLASIQKGKLDRISIERYIETLRQAKSQMMSFLEATKHEK